MASPDLPSLIIRPTFGFLFATFLSIRGLRKRSLSQSGAVAAWFIGFISMAASWRFGAILILFYQSSSSLTKYKADVKARLEDHFLEGGQRSATQVLACSLLATLLAVAYVWLCGADAPLDFQGHALRSRLLCAYVGHYACCNGDTWASELGILSPHAPRLITSAFTREVPRGTNGGMSLFGTLASLIGGAFIGAGFTLLGQLCGIPEVGGRVLPAWLHMTVLGGLCGFVGSLLDSLVGAIWQISWYCPERKCIIQSPTRAEVESGAVIRVCGRDVLTNEQVNLITVWLTTAAAPWLGELLW